MAPAGRISPPIVHREIGIPYLVLYRKTTGYCIDVMPRGIVENRPHVLVWSASPHCLNHLARLPNRIGGTFVRPEAGSTAKLFSTSARSRRRGRCANGQLGSKTR